jgi:hypothetical protein
MSMCGPQLRADTQPAVDTLERQSQRGATLLQLREVVCYKSFER